MPSKDSFDFDKDLVKSDSVYTKTELLIKIIYEYDTKATEAERLFRLGKIQFLKVNWMFVFFLYRQVSPFIKSKKITSGDGLITYRDEYEKRLKEIDKDLRDTFQSIELPNGTIKPNMSTVLREDLEKVNWELSDMHQIFIEILCRKGLYMSWKPNEQKRRTNNQKLQDALLG